jgi:hypothetical protein
LVGGRPTRGQVKKGEYDYYEFDFDNLGEKEVVIDLTPISGDSELVIAVRDELAYPTTSVFDISSQSIGFNSIRITEEMLYSVGPSCMRKTKYHQCSIVIGVVTLYSEHSIFTILASVEDKS